MAAIWFSASWKAKLAAVVIVLFTTRFSFAFLTNLASSCISSASKQSCRIGNQSSQKRHAKRWFTVGMAENSDDKISAPVTDEKEEQIEKRELSHSDIVWKLEPPKDTPTAERLKLKLAAKSIRMDCLVRNETLPIVLCPKGGQAVLEAHIKEEVVKSAGKKRPNARFGITTTTGPPSQEIYDTIREVYEIEPPALVGVAAIIYMFVEPEFRGFNIGKLALEVIAAIHSTQGCSFTVLVADDNGSGKLVEWYEKLGFARAPKLQACMGSPDGIYGTTMIGPAFISPGFQERCQIKWW